MGQPPEDLTIDRIDNDGNYEPSNCQWSTAREQAMNRAKKRPQKAIVDRKYAQEMMISSVCAGQIWEAMYDTPVKFLEVVLVDGDVVHIRRLGMRPPHGGIGCPRPYPIVKAQKTRFNGLGGGYRPFNELSSTSPK